MKTKNLRWKTCWFSNFLIAAALTLTSTGFADNSAIVPVSRPSAGWMQRHESMNQQARERKIDLIYVGDSIVEHFDTQGKEVWEQYYAPRNALNLGIGGDRTEHVLWRLDHGNIDGLAPKLAIVMIGQNNGGKNTGEEIGAGVVAIVQKLRAKLPNTKILLLGIFQRREKPTPERAVLAQANEIASKLADDKIIFYMDINRIYVQPDGSIPRSLMYDFEHPTPLGHRVWAEAIETKVAELMGDKPIACGERFLVQGHNAFVILPPTTPTNGAIPWVWYAPTLPGLPGDEEQWMFAKFSQAGIAIAGIDVGESYGSPDGRALYSALYDELTQHRGFAAKAVLLGRSRGGLMTLAWAAENADKVAGCAGIYPVCNLASYPGVTNACGAYHMTAEEFSARLTEHNPIDRLAALAKAGVPLFAIHGDSDQTVPLDANSGELRKRYEALGGKMQLIIPPGQGHNLWEGFFQSQELVDFVVAQAQRTNATITPERMLLWNGSAPIGDGKQEAANAFITVYRPAHANGAAMIICPGGGYGGLVTGPEGTGIAQWLNLHGLTGIVLEYRLPQGNPLRPLLDAQRAIRTARANAEKWGLDPNRIGIVGFSAGGHLAATTATHFNAGNAGADPIEKFGSRPDFAVLIYPVITMGDITHGGSRANLLGSNPTAEMVALYSNEQQVTDQTSPTFLAHAQDDTLVSCENSRMFYEALQNHHVASQYLELPSGGHGLNGYQGPMWEAWQTGSLQWLATQKFISTADTK